MKGPDGDWIAQPPAYEPIVAEERVLGALALLVRDELRSAWGVKGDLQKLQDTLSAIHAVLLDAEEQQASNHRLRLWLRRLKDVCYDAEDALDEFEAESLRKQVVNRGGINKKVCHFFSSSNPAVVSFTLAKKIKKIRQKLAEIEKEKNEFNLTQKVDNKHVRIRERETHSFVEATEVIGRDENRERLINLLMHSTDGANPSVIPIVGVGGVGKTALTKLVFNDERVMRHFTLKMWVCVSNDFDVKQLIVKIIKSGCGQDYSNCDLDQLQGRLRDSLNGQRYLLILDDVWNEDVAKWNELKALLVGVAGESKVIVTTRSHRVAAIMGTVSAHNLENLPYESCLSLFIKCAFREGQEKEHPNLIKIGEEIVKKCGGIPLVVKTLAAALFSVTDERQWTSIRDNEVWEQEPKEDGILTVLKLSYGQLPSHLKSCFTCCSLFPKDYSFNSIELIQLWMAHGLLKSSQRNEELQDVGLRYLMELWSRSFFQDFNNYGNIVSFKMHDIMHDLALFIAKDECIIVNESGQQISNSVRHLAISNIEMLEQDKNVLRLLCDNSCNVRTIFCPGLGAGPFHKDFLNMCFRKFKGLRVLKMNYSSFEVLPSSIGTLKYLRYLDLKDNQLIKKLPDSISKLHGLQTFIISGCSELEELPKDMKDMISLGVLVFTTKQKCLADNGIEHLRSLQSLWIGHCENLEYLFEGTQGLSTLRDLIIFKCPSLISLPHGLKYLTSLKALGIRDCEKIDLKMELEGKDNQPVDVNALFSLKILGISGLPKLISLPHWLLHGSLSSLEYISIQRCKNLTELPESLPNLKVLKFLQIEGCPSLITLPRGMKGLTALKELMIGGCESLNLMMEDDDQDQLTGFKLEKLYMEGVPRLVTFPHWLLQRSTESLERMAVKNCPQLKSLPEEINHFTSLKFLMIQNCPALSARYEPGTGEAYPNIAHVQNIIIEGINVKSIANQVLKDGPKVF